MTDFDAKWEKPLHQCSERHSSGWMCTREKDHPADHIARFTNSGFICAEWSRDGTYYWDLYQR